jgi:hypothetical protein
MPEPTFSMTADDDLPRTIRRERDAQREREAREREARERQPAIAMPTPRRESDIALEAPRSPLATVVDFDVPITRLAKFFLKAVFAAIPALLALMALLWVLGHTLQMFFPQLVKMKIDVQIYSPQSADDFRPVGKERR